MIPAGTLSKSQMSDDFVWALYLMSKRGSHDFGRDTQKMVREDDFVSGPLSGQNDCTIGCTLRQKMVREC